MNLHKINRKVLIQSYLPYNCSQFDVNGNLNFRDHSHLNSVSNLYHWQAHLRFYLHIPLINESIWKFWKSV
jgi:hypothetical protein